MTPGNVSYLDKLGEEMMDCAGDWVRKLAPWYPASKIADPDITNS